MPLPPSRSISCFRIRLCGEGSTKRHGAELGEGGVDASLVFDFHLAVEGLGELLGVMGPFREGDEGGEVVGHDHLELSLLDQAHH
jgi:hypothetical protein